MDEPVQIPLEFSLEAISDPETVRDIVKGLLHTIFFHRYFPTIEPRTRRCLDHRLPYVVDAELETLIDQRVEKLLVDLELKQPGTPVPGSTLGVGSLPTSTNTSATSSPMPTHIGGRLGHYIGQPTPQNGNKRGIVKVQYYERKKRNGWLPRGDEEVCWESWTIKISIAEPRNENDRAKLRKAMSRTLLAEVLKITTCASQNKSHIPPITTGGATNPFPYQITVNPKELAWPARLRMY